ncbi:hypothetical protein [Bradyrhizobium genosp. P]|uniref:hypothetical protein n=1 Tax=Bradyrhizobium genosp. P TaxID=83641 RepID=UPI003CECEC37
MDIKRQILIEIEWCHDHSQIRDAISDTGGTTYRFLVADCRCIASCQSLTLELPRVRGWPFNPVRCRQQDL